MRSHYLRLLLALLLSLACQGANIHGAAGPTVDPRNPLEPPDPPAGAPLALTRFRSDSVAFAFYSCIREPANLVIRDAAAWSHLWQDIHATVEPSPPLPEIDFSQEMIVAAALGTRSSGGYNVFLAQATEEAGAVQVEVLETSPGADCVTTQALTQPIDLARMPRRDDAVRFVVTRRVRPCGPPRVASSRA